MMRMRNAIAEEGQPWVRTQLTFMWFRIASKCVTSKDPENCEGFLAAFATYFLWNHPIVVQDIADFIRRVPPAI